jgi:gamma-glutamyltranspeptidase/glutathione hydrolase
MLSSMSPTLLRDAGGVRMIVGTPGGSTIFTSVFQAIVNVLDFAMTPAQAVAAPRFHHQLLPPDLVTYSPGRPLEAAVIAELAQRGYDVQPHAWEFGDLQLIWDDGRRVQAAADPRGRGVGRVLPVAEAALQLSGTVLHLNPNPCAAGDSHYFRGISTCP